jgi:hypothetical protein
MHDKNFVLGMVYWPLFLSAFLVLWTLLVSPHSKYGEYWAIGPALLVFPLVVFMHVILLIKGDWRPSLIVYGIVHASLLFVIWVLCLMLISKDSL